MGSVLPGGNLFEIVEVGSQVELVGSRGLIPPGMCFPRWETIGNLRQNPTFIWRDPMWDPTWDPNWDPAKLRRDPTRDTSGIPVGIGGIPPYIFTWVVSYFFKPLEKQRACVVDCNDICLLYTSPSPRDLSTSRMPSSA